MTYRDILREQLRIDEGVRTHPYVDTVGKLTIGVGRNLTDVGVSDDEIALMLEHDIEDAESVARTLIPTFDSLSEERKAVLCNMAFNLGHGRLAKFHDTMLAVREGRWADAADGMRRSLWAKQVGQRAERLAKIMEGDTA